MNTIVYIHIYYNYNIYIYLFIYCIVNILIMVDKEGIIFKLGVVYPIHIKKHCIIIIIWKCILDVNAKINSFAIFEYPGEMSPA